MQLVGGPLDGLLLGVTGWTEAEIAEGAALVTELGRFGAGGRALYEPEQGGDRSRFHWSSDTPCPDTEGRRCAGGVWGPGPGGVRAPRLYARRGSLAYFTRYNERHRAGDTRRGPCRLRPARTHRI
ncbi:hypothetical protein GCM10010515_42500 [Streptomyces fructofermentans]|uniref:Uncharacterized protein n=1 Tax=Streptomyces fructofermentans TaxID=152141 RepID=A0A918NIM0_9ACTN|nr:hypothetical protein GCM10010515_42500 [Streptomyces fructofermentans]